MTGDAGRERREIDEYEAESTADEKLVLSDLVNRVLDKGVVISGQVTISVADVDLIALDLRVLITSIQTAMSRTSALADQETE